MRGQGRLLRGLVVVPVLAGAALLGWHDASIHNSGDVDAFANAGSVMLSGRWAYAFAGAGLQASPLETGLAALARDAGGSAIGFAIAIDLVCTAAMLVAALAFLPRRGWALALFGAVTVAVHLPGAAYVGHPAEPLIAVLWLFAAREARRGRVVLAGALVGASGCLELWGVVGVAVLALAPFAAWRRSVVAVAVAAVVPLLALAPFAAAGHFHMFQMQWTIARGVPSMLFGAGRPFTWWMRFAEGATIVAAAAVSARLVRRLPECVWIVPAVLALLRIALDQLAYGYYWDAALVPLAIGTAAVLAQPRVLRDRVATRLAPGAST